MDWMAARLEVVETVEEEVDETGFANDREVVSVSRQSDTEGLQCFDDSCDEEASGRGVTEALMVTISIEVVVDVAVVVVAYVVVTAAGNVSVL